MFGISKRPFCVKGGEIIGNVPTIEELAFYIKEYILNDGYGSEWGSDNVKGATRKAIYDMHQTVVGQLEYKGLWDASVGSYPVGPELGWYYVVSVAGEAGGIWYMVGDWIIWNGTGWDKLVAKGDVFPIGSKIDYFGFGIKGFIATRDYEISIVNGDDFDLIGWFVANGVAGTPSCLGKFVRGGEIAGSTGGSDNAITVAHDHIATQEGHKHAVAYTNVAGTYSQFHAPASFTENAELSKNTDIKAPVITVNVNGVPGLNKNIPEYINSIPVIRMS